MPKSLPSPGRDSDDWGGTGHPADGRWLTIELRSKGVPVAPPHLLRDKEARSPSDGVRRGEMLASTVRVRTNDGRRLACHPESGSRLPKSEVAAPPKASSSRCCLTGRAQCSSAAHGGNSVGRSRWHFATHGDTLLTLRRSRCTRAPSSSLLVAGNGAGVERAAASSSQTSRQCLLKLGGAHRDARPRRVHERRDPR